MNAEAPWAEQEWGPETARRKQRRAIGIFLVGLSVAAALFLASMAASLIRWPTPLTLGILSAAGVLALGGMIVAPYVAPYRLCGESMPTTVFHVSSALWDEGETVTLEVARCRKSNRQYVAAGGRPTKTALVFFFPRRPTIENARGQLLKGKSRARRYLYELQPTHVVDVVYARTSARATPADLTAIVVRRQELEPLRTRRR